MPTPFYEIVRELFEGSSAQQRSSIPTFRGRITASAASSYSRGPDGEPSDSVLTRSRQQSSEQRQSPTQTAGPSGGTAFTSQTRGSIDQQPGRGGAASSGDSGMPIAFDSKSLASEMANSHLVRSSCGIVARLVQVGVAFSSDCSSFAQLEALKVRLGDDIEEELKQFQSLAPHLQPLLPYRRWFEAVADDLIECCRDIPLLIVNATMLGIFGAGESWLPRMLCFMQASCSILLTLAQKPPLPQTFANRYGSETEVQPASGAPHAMSGRNLADMLRVDAWEPLCAQFLHSLLLLRLCRKLYRRHTNEHLDSASGLGAEPASLRALESQLSSVPSQSTNDGGSRTSEESNITSIASRRYCRQLSKPLFFVLLTLHERLNVMIGQFEARVGSRDYRPSTATGDTSQRASHGGEHDHTETERLQKRQVIVIGMSHPMRRLDYAISDSFVFCFCGTNVHIVADVARIAANSTTEGFWGAGSTSNPHIEREMCAALDNMPPEVQSTFVGRQLRQLRHTDDSRRSRYSPPRSPLSDDSQLSGLSKRLHNDLVPLSEGVLQGKVEVALQCAAFDVLARLSNFPSSFSTSRNWLPRPRRADGEEHEKRLAHSRDANAVRNYGEVSVNSGWSSNGGKFFRSPLDARVSNHVSGRTRT